MEFLHLPVRYLPSGFMAFPDDTRVSFVGPLFRCMVERSVPRPPVRPDDADASFGKVHSGFSSHPAARINIARLTKDLARSRIHDDDIERLQLVIDSR